MVTNKINKLIPAITVSRRTLTSGHEGVPNKGSWLYDRNGLPRIQYEDCKAQPKPLPQCGDTTQLFYRTSPI